MNRTVNYLAITVGLLVGTALSPTASHSLSITDYESSVPFISDIVPPNILLLMDNSGSMADRACDSTNCGVHADGTTTPVVTTFVATTTYTGFFAPLGCYTYNGTDKRFEISTLRASVSTACSSTTWDGNFLNWVTFRRFDAVKKAFTGGDCSVSRNADGTCPASGTPALKTVKGQSTFPNTGAGNQETGAVPSTGANSFVGRVPDTVAKGGNSTVPANLYFHVRGGTSGMGGTFCLDNDSTKPSDTATTCADTESRGVIAFNESQFTIAVGLTTEPTGVIQQVGSKARFGLLQFKGAGDGGQVLTGIGARQSIAFGGTTVSTFNSNTAAILDAIGKSYPSTWTPLSEALYDGVRYIAQINSTYVTTSYTFPIAFAGGNSNGANFQTAGVGSIGTSEITALTGSETCPSGYINNACGRDPYFYGSNHTPKWASTSSLVKCCKTFIMILTDGEPTQDTNIPTALQDYGHAAHGTHCTGGSTTIHTANGTCNTNTATPPANLIAEHKTDYSSSGNHYLDDVAYWAHTNDLRPCSGNIAVINEAGHCVDGVQTATVYTFFTFGNIAGREILMKTAKLGGFEDSNVNNLPDLTSEWDKVNNLTGAATPDGIPDTFFESANVDDLESRLLAAITSMLGHAASGTAISVLATSATGDGAVYQSYFFPVSEGVVWTGYTQGLFIDDLGNIREDTDGDHRLVYSKDNIVVTYFDTTTNDSKVHRFADANGDGIADSTTPVSVGETTAVDLRDMSPLWEAGKQLALKSAGSRKILTWVDSNGDKVVTASEQISFDSTNLTALTPYLRGDATGIFTAVNIVEFIRGTQIDGMRNRQVQVPRNSGTSYVWKLGDSVHATPTVIGAPRERYDVIYGDASYTAFFQKYKNRRQVAYVGANDGMIHAFNGGYFHKGDDPNTTSVTEHGYFTKNATDDSSGAALGDELWAFIPQELLPHLRWLTQPDYQHIYYVDLKPKVTDARIFNDDATHPGGWGTILIAGFGLGGSCGDTTSGTACKEMAVSATFSGGVQSTRKFYSAYVVLDITDPEQNPVLLWSFSQADLGYTTSFPAILRLKPSCTAANCKVDNTDAKWYMVAGSGPTDYSGSSTQTAKIFAVDLKAGPVDASTGASLAKSFSTGDANTFMGDAISVDAQLDYRMDAVYMGSVINNGTASPSWLGKLYRLTTKQGSTETADWGVLSGGARVPSVILSTFASDTGTTLKVGPISAAPNVSADDTNNLWVFFGTGRLYTSADKTNTDSQYFLGVKDPIVSGGSCTETATPPASPAGCRTDDLVNVTNVSVCTVCGSGSQVTGAGTGITSLLGTDATTTLQGKVQSKSGWYTSLTGTYERVLASPTLSGGAIFFPTFIPTTSASTDICTTEAGSGKIYALYYKTGSAYKASIIGTEAGSTAGTTVASKSVSLGKGMASQFAVHIGAQGKGAVGTLVQASGDGSITSQTTTGSEGRITIIDQNSLGGTNKIAAAAPLASWSRMLSWINQRD